MDGWMDGWSKVLHPLGTKQVILEMVSQPISGRGTEKSKSEYARVLGPYHSPKRVPTKLWPAGGAHCGLDLKCQIMKKINNAMTDEK